VTSCCVDQCLRDRHRVFVLRSSSVEVYEVHADSPSAILLLHRYNTWNPLAYLHGLMNPVIHQNPLRGQNALSDPYEAKRCILIGRSCFALDLACSFHAIFPKYTCTHI
jgi:hypothetical protein